MKLVNTLIALGAIELVNGEIIIHNNHIEETLHNLGHWAKEEVNNKDFGELARSIMTANEEATVKNIQANTHIVEHILNIAEKQIDVQKFLFPHDCSAVKYAKCMTQKENWKQDANGWSNQWMEQDLQCWKKADCYRPWNHLSQEDKQDIEDDFHHMQENTHEIKHEFIWATHNWEHKIEKAVQSHQKQLDKVVGDLEGEVEHLMVQGGCNQQCVTKMKDDGMLDDPSYVAYECQCASKWIQYEDSEIQEQPIELAKDTTTPTDKSGAIHLTEFTCACIIIFAVQAILCFFMLAWCQKKLYRTDRQKVTKQSDFYEFLYEFHEQMANEGDQINAINGTPGGTPGGPTPGR